MFLSLNRNIFILFHTLYLLIPFNSAACTVFSIQNKDQVVLAKNLDWPIENGLIFINKRDVNKIAFTESENKLEWVSKYGSITFNQFGKEFPLGGINEKGLVVEELNNWGEVPDNDSLFKLNEFQIVQYILDNFSSVYELEKLYEITISPIFINLHYFITDKNGNKVILEFYNRKMFLYFDDDIPYPVLSNNHYENSLKYIMHFKPFGGEQDVPDSNSSNDRFLKTAISISSVENIDNNDITPKAFRFLKNIEQEDTQWSIVYDIKNMKIFFHTKSNSKIRSIDVDEFDFSCETSALSYLISNNDKNGINDKFIAEINQQNKKLVLDVYEKYLEFQLGNLKKKVFIDLYEFGNSIKCE